MVTAKKRVQKTCKDSYVVRMDKYLGRCCLMVEKLADRCRLRFDEVSEGTCLDVKWEFAEGE